MGSRASEKQLSADRYRDLFGVVPSAVAVVTTATADGPHGTTVSAFGPLSLDPPLVQVCLDRDSRLLARIAESGRFLINVLAHEQHQLARRFARKGDDDFEGIAWNPRGGMPAIEGCHGWLAATVERTVEAGDHQMLFGLAFDSEIFSGVPLLYNERTFHVLAPVVEE
jgi:flavin reductase (DIM6/NTAB) family NADH-FMN oxidoreductase RutF